MPYSLLPDYALTDSESLDETLEPTPTNRGLAENRFGQSQDWSGSAFAEVPRIHWPDVANLNPERTVLLDVRPGTERAPVGASGTLHLPLEELRSRLAELPRHFDLVVHCRNDQRSHHACRILMENGFNARQLAPLDR